MKKNKKKLNSTNNSCPRCGGWLLRAEDWYYQWRFAFQGCLHCINCGRNWRNEGGKLSPYERHILQEQERREVA